MSWLWVVLALFLLLTVKAVVEACRETRRESLSKYAKGPVAGTDRTHGEGTAFREEWTKRQDRIRGRSQGWDREFPTE